MDDEARVGVAQAAEELGLSSQRVRDLIRAGKLEACKRSNGRWLIDATSFRSYLASGDAQKPRRPTHREIARRLNELSAAVTALVESDRTSVSLLDAVERERDRYRADAAAVREAALRLLASAEDTQNAVVTLLNVMRTQGDALAQLLAPGSPQDLLPASERRSRKPS